MALPSKEKQTKAEGEGMAGRQDGGEAEHEGEDVSQSQPMEQQRQQMVQSQGPETLRQQMQASHHPPTAVVSSQMFSSQQAAPFLKNMSHAATPQRAPSPMPKAPRQQ